MNLLQAWCSPAAPPCRSLHLGSDLPRASLPRERNSASSPDSVDCGNRASLTGEWWCHLVDDLAG